jgi:CBS domain-containing protein
MMSKQNNYLEKVKNHPLFSGTSVAELEGLLEQCELNSYSRGDKILYAKSVREGLLLMMEGIAEVCVDTGQEPTDQEVLEVLEAGEIIGFSSLADFLGEANPHEENYTVEVNAAENSVCLYIPYTVLEARWSDEGVRDYMMRQVAVRLREVYASLAEQVRLARQWGESDPFIRRVQDLMNQPPVTVTASTPVQDAARYMVEAGVSSLLITDRNDQLCGIITEKDIVSRVVSAGDSGHLTAEDIMTPEPVDVSRSAYYYEALSKFLTNGVKHLPVTDKGKPLGMVTLSDLLRKKSRGTFDVLQKIEHSTAENLHEVKHAIYGVLDKLIEDDIPTLHVMEVITNLYDRLVRHCADLTVEKMAEQGYGKPPVSFVFFVMGSGGRGEQFMLSDQDHFLVYEDIHHEQAKDVEAYFSTFGIFITEMMEAAGYKRCQGDMMASSGKWRGTITRWEERLRTWGLRATNENILLGHNFLSFRYLYGDEELEGKFTQMVKEQLNKSRIFLYRAAEQEKQSPVPTLDHPIRALFRMKRDKIDIKKQALFPLYHGLQLLGARHGIVDGTPKERVSLLEAENVFTREFADDLLFAYEVVLSIRVSQSWARYKRGEENSSVVHFVHMKSREKEELMHALKTIRSLQNKTLAAFGIM